MFLTATVKFDLGSQEGVATSKISLPPSPTHTWTAPVDVCVVGLFPGLLVIFRSRNTLKVTGLKGLSLPPQWYWNTPKFSFPEVWHCCSSFFPDLRPSQAFRTVVQYLNPYSLNHMDLSQKFIGMEWLSGCLHGHFHSTIHQAALLCQTPPCFPTEAQPPGMLKALDLFQFHGC